MPIRGNLGSRNEVVFREEYPNFASVVTSITIDLYYYTPQQSSRALMIETNNRQHTRDTVLVMIDSIPPR